jgi:hypothetical protein
MPFKITIQETKEVIATTGKEYVQIDTEEVEREDRWASQEDEPKTRIKPVYGYSPEVEKKVSVTREVLTQTVEELDVNKVIRAINGIE